MDRSKRSCWMVTEITRLHTLKFLFLWNYMKSVAHQMRCRNIEELKELNYERSKMIGRNTDIMKHTSTELKWVIKKKKKISTCNITFNTLSLWCTTFVSCVFQIISTSLAILFFLKKKKNLSLSMYVKTSVISKNNCRKLI